MPVARLTRGAALWCVVLLVVGCRNDGDQCPRASVTADPAEIPEGTSETNLSVQVSNPFPDNGLEVVTELSAKSGAVADPFARETTYACPHDLSGPVEICATATYTDDSAASGALGEVPGVEAFREYLRGPNVYLQSPLECSTAQCIDVVCPEVKNACPEISSLTIDPELVSEGETATVTVVAVDPDDNPEALVTTVTARHGAIADPNASSTTYACDSEVGGVIEICVVASDGDPSCDVEQCTTVRCPGDPLENTCPIIEGLTATPMTVPPGETTTTVRVDATDPDDFPVPLRTELSSETGVFEDKFALETTFTCGDSGPVEICVRANDGDAKCNETRCMTVQCPSDIPPNLCPQLFVINSIPRVIPEGQSSTHVETRGQDTDGLPIPLTLTLNTLWGSFENTENLQEPLNVVAQNATYICDRPGLVEVCVDATDGACTKTLCDTIICPDDITTPP